MSADRSPDLLTVGFAQIAPVWLDRQRTLAKIGAHVEAAATGCQIVAFGGTKPSGNGREGLHQTLLEMTEQRTLLISDVYEPAANWG